LGIEIHGLDSLFSKLSAIPGAIEAAGVEGVDKTLMDITATAKELCPVDTGQLRDSLEPYAETHKAKSDGAAISGAAGTNVEHGPYVELGTGPVGEETAADGKYPGPVSYTQKGWTYFDEKLGQFVHTRGQPAQPYLYPATQQHAAELPENVKKAAQVRLEELAK
jgi:HK97 gp10 family phage protein